MNSKNNSLQDWQIINPDFFCYYQHTITQSKKKFAYVAIYAF